MSLEFHEVHAVWNWKKQVSAITQGLGLLSLNCSGRMWLPGISLGVPTQGLGRVGKLRSVATARTTQSLFSGVGGWRMGHTINIDALVGRSPGNAFWSN